MLGRDIARTSRIGKVRGLDGKMSDGSADFHVWAGSLAREAVMTSPDINFRRVAGAALARSDSILTRWLPDGRREGAEWVSRNPRRHDRRPGSFKVNLETGKWGDFASNAFGGDLVSLAAYLLGLSQTEAARKVAAMIGIDPHG